MNSLIQPRFGATCGVLFLLLIIMTGVFHNWERQKESNYVETKCIVLNSTVILYKDYGGSSPLMHILMYRKWSNFASMTLKSSRTTYLLVWFIEQNGSIVSINNTVRYSNIEEVYMCANYNEAINELNKYPVNIMN